MTIKALGKAAAPQSTSEFVNQGEILKLKQLQQEMAAQKEQLINAQQGMVALPMEMQERILTELTIVENQIKAAENLEAMFVSGGKLPDGSDIDIKALEQKLAGLESGWHDASGKLETYPLPSDLKQVMQGTYRHAIRTENLGYDASKPQSANFVAIVIPETIDGKKVIGFNSMTVGRDVHAQFVLEDGSKVVDVIVGKGVRPENLVVYAGHLNHAIHIDMHRTLMVSDGTADDPGKKYGAIIIGTEKDDTIVGTQGNDTIAGNGGNDILDGSGGFDNVFGDHMDGNGVNGSGVGTAGDDIIYAGVGDIIDAGKGAQDKVYNKEGATVIHEELYGNGTNLAQPTPNFITASGLSITQNNYKDGVLVIDADDVTANGTITMQVPNGYTLASFTPSGSKLAMEATFVKYVNGVPETIKVRINNYASPENSGIRYVVNGNGLANIIDASGVESYGNWTINGGAGHDVIAAPTMFSDLIGVPYDELSLSTQSKKANTKLVEYLRTAKIMGDPPSLDNAAYYVTWGLQAGGPDGNGDAFWADYKDTDNTKFLSGDNIKLTLGQGSPQPESLNFKTPPGFENGDAFLMHKDGKDLLIFTNPSVDGVERVVVEISGITGLGTTVPVMVDGSVVKTLHDITVVDGGTGTDTVFGSSTSMKATADFLNTGIYAPDLSAIDISSESSADKIQALKDKKTPLQAQITAEENAYKALIDTNQDDQAKEKLKQIEKLYTQLAQIDKELKDLEATSKGE
jgi:hypothetical protein